MTGKERLVIGFIEGSARHSAGLRSTSGASGSPGRVFLLDEADLASRLSSLETYTKGRYRWSETAGLKQIIRERPLSDANSFRAVNLMCHNQFSHNSPFKKCSVPCCRRSGLTTRFVSLQWP